MQILNILFTGAPAAKSHGFFLFLLSLLCLLSLLLGFARNVPAAEGELHIIAAGLTGDIKHFARKIQAGDFFGFHG